jgi:hypothetical protein
MYNQLYSSVTGIHSSIAESIIVELP